ncbi:hypothetical protein [Hyalangium rubrum]|uniref:Uncharacterized protein n=1 Tax=Hyalangium rubrum TaxID=3103134 RepID=A0ABU5H1D3_9BACT|nr:hypothetical protein [Hyalangium sp. s54d21]MDY7227254.1 hypothetical protein [Hyalangium sp. s54d21]
MSERLRAPVSSSSPERELTLEDVRRTLEGRLEVIEAAQKRYAVLERRLKGAGWKRRLRAWRGFSKEVLQHEAELAEALSRARRRAELAGWPETLPALEPLRDVGARRARLEALVQKRLGELALPSGPPTLEEDLVRLEAVLREPRVSAPGPGETRLLEMKRNEYFPLPVAALIAVFLPLVHFASLWGGTTPALITVVTFVCLLVTYALRAGEFWLTSERLVWRPVLGEPVSVSLRSIQAGGVQVERFMRSVRVQGDRRVHVRYVEPLHKLAALVEMHRQPPFLGSSRGGQRLSNVSLFEVVLWEGPGHRVRTGWAVLRPEGVSFLPVGSGTQTFQAITGAAAPAGVNLDVSWVLEELRWLPGTEFDACLARAVKATDGVYWSAWEARRASGVPVWKEIHITRVHGTGSMSGKVDWSQLDATERLFDSWPAS